MDKVLLTPAKPVQIINRVKDSKFYGDINRAVHEEQVKDFINLIKAKYHDANHHVSAYLLGSGVLLSKNANDDGEPAGSSGRPVLQAIEGAGLTNTVIVVTRYFGGTKLGIGGLIRAYGETARLLIKQVVIQKLQLYYQLTIVGAYNQLGNILGQLSAHHAEILSTEYTNTGGIITVLIKPELYSSLQERLIEKTANQVRIENREDIYR